MTLDPPLILAGLLVGIVVGLTGMGGGALMTPMLVFFAGIDPLTAISSDVVVSLFMKPSAAFVHVRRGTVNLGLVGWLCLGSVPAAFLGAVVVGSIPPGPELENALKQLLGIALLVATAGLVVRAGIQLWRNRLPLGEGPAEEVLPEVVIRPIPVVLLGIVAGFMVGMTSVGAGSIVIVALLLMYPALKASSLVGTDLTQAIPLVAAAAAGHLLFGSFSLVIAASLLIGAIPGAWLGAHASSRAPGGLIRRILAIVLLASGLKLIGATSEQVLIAVAIAVAVAIGSWLVLRSRPIRLTVEPRRDSGEPDPTRLDAPA